MILNLNATSYWPTPITMPVVLWVSDVSIGRCGLQYTTRQQQLRTVLLLKSYVNNNFIHYILAVWVPTLLLRPSTGAAYCNQFVCLYVSVCVSVREHISGTAGPIFTNFFSAEPVAVDWSSSGGIAIRYVLPVLWIMSCLAVMGRKVMHGSLNL